jgi:hypothetical protein
MKTGELLKLCLSSGPYYIGAWSNEYNRLDNKLLGNLYNNDIVIYIKNSSNEKQYIIALSKYGLCNVNKACFERINC